MYRVPYELEYMCMHPYGPELHQAKAEHRTTRISTLTYYADLFSFFLRTDEIKPGNIHPVQT